MKRKKNKRKVSFFIVFIIGFIVLFISSILIVDFINNNRKFDISTVIADSNYDIVYEVDNSPKINISGEDISAINSEIKDYYNNNSNNDKFEYEYNVSIDTLSLLITRYVIIDNKEYIEYKSYNYDLVNRKVLSNDEILSKYNITNEQLSFYIKNKFLNYYADLLDKGYIEGKKCDYNCFLSKCNFQDLDENNVLYIKKNHLYLYKFFDIYNEYNYYDYFSYDSFIFDVK